MEEQLTQLVRQGVRHKLSPTMRTSIQSLGCAVRLFHGSFQAAGNDSPGWVLGAHVMHVQNHTRESGQNKDMGRGFSKGSPCTREQSGCSAVGPSLGTVEGPLGAPSSVLGEHTVFRVWPQEDSVP